MPGIFLTTNIFAHVGGFFYALMSWGEAAQICFLPCAQRSEGAVITQPAERAECASERMVTDGYGCLRSRICREPPVVCSLRGCLRCRVSPVVCCLRGCLRCRVSPVVCSLRGCLRCRVSPVVCSLRECFAGRCFPGDHLVIASQKYGSHSPRDLCAASVTIRNHP